MELLAIRICSPQKNFAAHTLATIYTTPMLQAFFRQMHDLRIPYGIFSRKYGLQREGPDHHAYPSIDEISDAALVALLTTQFDQFRNTIFLYWNHRPLTHTKYVRMLRQVGFTVIELRTLKAFELYAGDPMREERLERLRHFARNHRDYVAAFLKIAPYEDLETDKYVVRIHGLEYNLSVIEDIEAQYYENKKEIIPHGCPTKTLNAWILSLNKENLVK
jgi:hypothetical protein